jgi:alpha-N-arabinofuranosidase
MLTATGRLDPREAIGPISRRLFGSFVEHMGRGVYGGLYEPGHPTADEAGFRRDVLELVREMGVTVVRYPGGNFVSGYRWEDGVGPHGLRPRRLDPAWRSLETNAFGLDEFRSWTRRAGVEPMYALNLGTRGIQEAIDLLEYANHPAGSTISDRRVSNGSVEPHDIRMWCLGNEMDGPWQLGHMTATEYARKAAETARAMRQFDPTLELVACGSSHSAMPTYGVWEESVLAETYELVDFVSLHAYYEELDGDLGSFLASAVDLERSIETVAAIADTVGSRLGSAKRMQLSVDEWNVWYLSHVAARMSEIHWDTAPRISEEAYTAADAVVVGSLLIALLKHADRVTCACLAQLVNTIATIKAEPGGPSWREASFYPFALTARAARGNALRVALDTPTISTAKYGDVPAVDTVASLDDASGHAAVFIVNRHPSEPVEFRLELPAWPGASIIETQLLRDGDIHAVNTMADPGRVVPHPFSRAHLTDGRLSVFLPPVSWGLVSLSTGHR